MKRIEFLVNDVRQSTDNMDTNAVSTQEIITYFNDAQAEIQSTIFQTNPLANIFTKTIFMDLVGEQGNYDLPSDIYAYNSLKLISRFSGDSAASLDLDDYYVMESILPEERRVFPGYWIEDNQLWINPTPTFGQQNALRITYFKRLPLIAQRVGQISSFVSGTSVTLAVGATDDLNTLDDYFCIVDKFGEIKAEGLNLNGYNNGSRVISTNSVIPGTITSSDFVVIGKLATTNIQLPDVCEPLLKDYVRSRIHTRNASSKEIRNQAEFTNEQKASVKAIFADNQKEILRAPVTDSDYLRY
jgi:hypothetical protein